MTEGWTDEEVRQLMDDCKLLTFSAPPAGGSESPHALNRSDVSTRQRDKRANQRSGGGPNDRDAVVLRQSHKHFKE